MVTRFAFFIAAGLFIEAGISGRPITDVVRGIASGSRRTKLEIPDPLTAGGGGGEGAVEGGTGGGFMDFMTGGPAYTKLRASMARFRGPYGYGSGHGPSLSSIGYGSAMDCSSSCSKALKDAGMFKGDTAIVSGAFASGWGVAGQGRKFTVYANGGHVFIQGKGWRFDTGGPGGGAGPRLRRQERSTAGFTPRHWPGM